MHSAADQAFLREAIAEARTGLAEGEVPIGAVAVRAGAIVARGHNRRNALNDLTCHAEMACLRAHLNKTRLRAVIGVIDRYQFRSRRGGGDESCKDHHSS